MAGFQRSVARGKSVVAPTTTRHCPAEQLHGDNEIAKTEDVIALLRAAVNGETARLHALALQIAANEDRSGRTRVARQVRDLADKISGRATEQRTSMSLQGDLADLLSVACPTTRLSDMTIGADTLRRLERILMEHRARERLREHGLSPRRKVLLAGPPGTGKTMTARALAVELSLPLFTLKLDSVFKSFLGETAGRLRKVFDFIRSHPGVYLFDEFDSLGQQRAMRDDVGEMRRVVNTLLTLIEEDTSDNLLIAATNHPDLLDKALFRRFDDVIEYSLPTADAVVSFLRQGVRTPAPDLDWSAVSSDAANLSYADLQRACNDARKDALLAGVDEVSTRTLAGAISERQHDRVSFGLDRLQTQ